MTSGEILDASLGVYQTMGWTLLRVSAVPSLMCLAALAFVFEHVLPSFAYTNNPSSIDAQILEALLKLALAVGIGGPLFFLGLSYAGALTTRIVGDYVSGAAPNIQAAERAARRDLPRVVALSFREALCAVAGVVLSALTLMASAWTSSRYPGSDLPVVLSVVSVVGLAFGLAAIPVVLALHALAIPACVAEGMRVKEAAKRGRALLKARPPLQPSGYDTVWSVLFIGSSWASLIFGGIMSTLQLTGAHAWIEQLPPTTPWRPLLIGAAQYVAPFLTIWTVVPIWCTTTTILYYERRIRLEGFDIESLAKDIWRADKQSRFEL